MTYKWKRDQIEHLIACIEQNSCIYFVKSPEYLDRVKKADAFNSILEEMQTMEPTITLEEIKRKWKNLRTQYMQELRAINQSKINGTGDTYVPKLWCFAQLDFLKVHSGMRTNKANMEVMASYNEFCNPKEEDNLSDGPPMKVQKRLHAINVFRNGLDLLNRKAEKKYAWLGTLVANQMEEINPEDQADAAWQVQCLMRRLTNNSYRNRNRNSSSTSNSSKDNHELP